MKDVMFVKTVSAVRPRVNCFRQRRLVQQHKCIVRPLVACVATGRVCTARSHEGPARQLRTLATICGAAACITSTVGLAWHATVLCGRHCSIASR